MGTTVSFVKLRSTETPKVGEWNINYDKVVSLAKKNNKPVIALWSNGDKCGYCVSLEKVLMEKTFIDWMKTSDCYFVFQYSGDKDGGKTLHDLIYAKGGKLKYFPGVTVIVYDPTSGKVLSQAYSDGNTLRGNKTGATGAKKVIENLTKALAKRPVTSVAGIDVTTTPVKYKIRFNEKLTVAKVNKILDAIDANGGYCPCQVKAEGTKCHCEDFIQCKKIGEPCICKIYVKQEVK